MNSDDVDKIVTAINSLENTIKMQLSSIETIYKIMLEKLIEATNPQ